MYTDRLVTGGKTGEVERGRLIEQQRTDMQASSYSTTEVRRIQQLVTVAKYRCVLLVSRWSEYRWRSYRFLFRPSWWAPNDLKLPYFTAITLFIQGAILGKTRICAYKQAAVTDTLTSNSHCSDFTNKTVFLVICIAEYAYFVFCSGVDNRTIF